MGVWSAATRYHHAFPVLPHIRFQCAGALAHSLATASAATPTPNPSPQGEGKSGRASGGVATTLLAHICPTSSGTL